jgi:hypothetical protein
VKTGSKVNIPLWVWTLYEAAMRTKTFHTTPMAYPLGEASSVMEDLCWGWVINDMVVKAVIKGEDFDKVIDEFQAKLEDMVREAYEQ